MREDRVLADDQSLALVIERDFAARPELLWALWRDPEHMVRWYGPEGCWLTTCDSDFRVGGGWRRCMTSAGGHAHWISGRYLEIAAPHRLSFTYVNAYDGFETVVTLDFVPLDSGGTRMLFRQAPFPSPDECDGHRRGWGSSFDLLTAYLEQFIDPDLRPRGRPRSDGVAEDLRAARERQEADRRATKSDGAGDRGA